MNRFFNACILAVLFTGQTGHAQTFPDTYFESSYGRLEYGFYVPEDHDSSRTYPLLMYLHGWGCNYSVYLDWYDRDIQSNNPCFVYTPKTPVSWADWSGWSSQLTEPMIAALHVLDSLITVYSIDTNRLYVYGISMGGEGTFDLLHKLPDKFAAAMSVCGGGQSWWAENISGTPFWMFHGSLDNVNPPALTEQVYNELVRIGAKKMRYTKYPGYGHEIWNVASCEPSWHDWMFAHSRNDTACPKPDGSIVLNGTVLDQNRIRLSWNDIRDPGDRANRIWYYKIYNRDSLIGTREYDETTLDFFVINPVDTFSVSGVNYHFKESDRSGILCYANGAFLTAMNNDVPDRQPTPHLYDNYPNPFNPATRISYSIPRPDHVSIIIYDLHARVVMTLVSEEKGTGRYSAEFDISSLPETRRILSSGIYFCQFRAGGYIQTKKMILLQ